uniref:Uncharacterized protein n=2 Tax=Ciona intestinalis TaxID=7719 RepID=F6XZP9_CIOIN
MILDSPDQSVSSETPVEFGDFHLTKDDWLNLPNGALLFKSYEKYLGDENLEQLEEYKEPVTSQDASMDEEESLASSETIPEENGNEGNRGALPSSEEIFERILLKFDEEDVVAMATKLGQTLHKISEDHQEDDVHDLALAGYFSSTMEEEYDQEVMGEAIVSLEKPKYPVSKIRKKQTELISRLSRHFMKNRHEVSTSSSNNSTETED